MAALELILTSSARYGVTPADLSNELQQLGLPREHSAALARIHTDVSSKIVNEALIPQSLRREISINRNLFSIDEIDCKKRTFLNFHQDLVTRSDFQGVVYLPSRLNEQAKTSVPSAEFH